MVFLLLLEMKLCSQLSLASIAQTDSCHLGLYKHRDFHLTVMQKYNKMSLLLKPELDTDSCGGCSAAWSANTPATPRAAPLQRWLCLRPACCLQPHPEDMSAYLLPALPVIFDLPLKMRPALLLGSMQAYVKCQYGEMCFHTGFKLLFLT